MPCDEDRPFRFQWGSRVLDPGLVPCALPHSVTFLLTNPRRSRICRPTVHGVHLRSDRGLKRARRRREDCRSVPHGPFAHRLRGWSTQRQEGARSLNDAFVRVSVNYACIRLIAFNKTSSSHSRRRVSYLCPFFSLSQLPFEPQQIINLIASPVPLER